MRLGRTALITITAAVTVTVGGAAALAGWGFPTTTLELTGHAGSLPAGPTPTARLTQQGTIRITWDSAQISNVTHRVTRHTDGAADVNVCPTGKSPCQDNVGAGGYTYSIRLAMGAWQGPSSASSAKVTIAAQAAAPAVATTATAGVLSTQAKTSDPQPEVTVAPTPTPSTSPSTSVETPVPSVEPSSEPVNP